MICVWASGLSKEDVGSGKSIGIIVFPATHVKDFRGVDLWVQVLQGQPKSFFMAWLMARALHSMVVQFLAFSFLERCRTECSSAKF